MPEQAAIEARPLLFGSFMSTGADERPLYAEVPGYDALRAALDGKLAEYNESNPNMDLVLFQQVRYWSAQTAKWYSSLAPDAAHTLPTMVVRCTAYPDFWAPQGIRIWCNWLQVPA